MRQHDANVGIGALAMILSEIRLLLLVVDVKPLTPGAARAMLSVNSAADGFGLAS